MLNTGRKWLKAFLALGVRKLDSPVASIFGTRVKFLDLLFLNKFTTILLARLPTPTTLLLLALNVFRPDSLDDLVVFNKEVSDAAILLKPRIKHQ